MTGSKRFSRAEADALLPSLAPALTELRSRFEEAEQVRARIVAAAATNGGSSDREQWQKTLARVQELLERITGWGVELRDIESGLVDFPSVVEGDDAFLCWKLGEPSVRYWHRPEDGFAGRRPLAG